MGEKKHDNLPLLMVLLLVLLLPLPADASRKVYIAYMGEKKHEDPSMVTASHHQTLASVLGSKDEALKSIVYSYKHGFSGFAAKLTESQAKELAKLPEVISVKPNTYHQVQTTRSWDFLGLNYYQPSGLLKKANYGKDIIVGVVDSGIWPESQSFDDSGYGPVPKRWKGVCQTGKAFKAKSCNRKIIGARWYFKDIQGQVPAEHLKGEYMSPRDFHGHGTHTASTVAGVPVHNASYGGLGAGVARGGAPRARVAAYKACWGTGGMYGHAALIAAIDDAIKDGVDVLSLSVGGAFENPGTLHAVARGITVVFSASNEGPMPYSVQNASPWVITVAASTITGPFRPRYRSAMEKSWWQSLNSAQAMNSSDFHTVVYANGCDEKSLESVNVTGNIILCFAPWEASKSLPLTKALVAARNVAIKHEAKGIIFAQNTNNAALDVLQHCNGLMPCVVVDYEIGYSIGKYADESSPGVAKISPAVTVVGDEVLSPRVAAFSSRGPSMVFPAILKPDIAAPGVSILAARRDWYELMSGTSMACPHVAAIVALLKSVHPDWSPAMIKSAIVTTASVTDRSGMPIQAEGVPRKLADPFDFGGGHIEPDKAVDPGLIYNIDPHEYIKFFNCTLGPKEECLEYMGNLYQLNLPSIAVPNLKDSVTVWRTVTNVGPVKSTYRAMSEAPAGAIMSVEPSVITFKKGSPRSVTFKVTFKAKKRVQGGYTFGSLTWFDGHTHSVRIPIAVRTVVKDFVADAS
ncbi:hypothetical protein ACP70R_008319 [Stipagrostis hirtigluma subsp. patula]